MFEKTARFYDAIYGSMKDYAAEVVRVEEIILARNPAAATLLDVACGTGLHLSYLQNRFECEGLDLDTGMLDVAAQRLPGVQLHQANMIDFDLHKRFDAVTCLFSAIGYTSTLNNMRAAVACMAAHLNPGGVLVIEPWLSPEMFDPDNSLHAVFVDESGLKIARIGRTSADGRACYVNFDYLIATPQESVHETERHTTGLFTTDEQMQAITDAGLQPEHDPDGLWTARSGTKRGVLIGTL